MERRTELRIKRALECAIYTEDGEYAGRIVDVSREGLAFEVDTAIGVEISELLTVSVCDSYVDMQGERKLFTENVKGTVKNIVHTEDSKIRYGCYIHNWAYQAYLQDLYTVNACGKLDNRL